MKDGSIMQHGAPQDVYDRPENLFVAKFLGSPQINVFDGQIKDGAVYIGKDRVIELNDITSFDKKQDHPDGNVYVAIRPEGFVTLSDPGESPCVLRCSFDKMEVMGRDTSIICHNPAAGSASVRAIIPSEDRPVIMGSEVCFKLKPSKVHVFYTE
jgi:multiple sugar transport system ATP-binding protein